MFRHLVPADWPPLRPGMYARSLIVLPAQSDRLDSLTDEFLIAGGRRYRGLGVVGLADDQGVRLNGGRPGAKAGPDAFRAALARYGLADCAALDSALPVVVDTGNVVPGRELEETHDRVTATVAELLHQGLLPVGIGGGHDLTLPLVRGLVNATGGALHGTYFDAHLDVREQAGSGMAFRRLIEDYGLNSLCCIGLDEFANSREHMQWFREHGGSLDAFSPDRWPTHPRQFVSIDLDVIDAAQAPGVSALNPAGMSAREISDYAQAAGRCPAVACFDIMELCPQHDVDGRTARLAAHLFLCFVQGCEMRIGEHSAKQEGRQ